MQRGVSADRLLRAFDSALLMAGIDGMLQRYNPAPGQAKSKPIQVIWDSSQRCFKAPLAPVFAVGDAFQLLDGKVFRVESVTLFEVAGTACYQQLEAKAVGLSRGPLRDSWDGKIPGAQF